MKSTFPILQFFHNFFVHFCSNRILHCVCHRRDISHFSHIWGHKCHVNHQGAHQTQYIMNQNHPGYPFSKDQTRQDHLFRPDQPNHRFWLIKRIIKNINAEPALFTLSFLNLFLFQFPHLHLPLPSQFRICLRGEGLTSCSSWKIMLWPSTTILIYSYIVLYLITLYLKSYLYHIMH